MKLAHRVAWEIYKGLIPEGFDIDHDDESVGCHTKSCVNVDHLNLTMTNHRRLSTNSSGEWAIRYHKRNQHWIVQIVAAGKFYSPATIGLPSSYRGEPPPAAPPQAAIEAREKLRAHLGLEEI